VSWGWIQRCEGGSNGDKRHGEEVGAGGGRSTTEKQGGGVRARVLVRAAAAALGGILAGLKVVAAVEG
jgi:hypothetical protein